MSANALPFHSAHLYDGLTKKETNSGFPAPVPGGFLVRMVKKWRTATFHVAMHNKLDYMTVIDQRMIMPPTGENR
jgi:hypothetical protein